MLLYILVFKAITTILQTNIYKIDKQQGPTIEHRELYSISCNKQYGKEYEKEYIFCSPETNTTL